MLACPLTLTPPPVADWRDDSYPDAITIAFNADEFAAVAEMDGENDTTPDE